MRLYTNGLSSYEPWSGAVDFYNEIVEEGKLKELEDALDELYPDGMSETELNDLLWHDEDWLRGFLDMDTEEKEDSYVYAIEDTRGLPQYGICEDNYLPCKNEAELIGTLETIRMLKQNRKVTQ